MNEFGMACMPLFKNVPNPKSGTWKKSTCPVCGSDCWETDTLQWAMQLGIIQRAMCTECALKDMNHD